MAARGWLLFVGGALALFVLSRCSFIVGGFNECNKDSDCAAGKVCLGATPDAGERYCVAQTIPEGCNSVPDAGVAAVYGNADAGNAIHVGAIYGFTSMGQSGLAISQTRVEQLNAVVLAMEEINQRGVGPNGRPLVLHVCDNGNNTELTKAQATWMADELHVPAVLVPSSNQVIAAATVTIPRGVLLMSPTATSAEITSLPATTDGGTRTVWRTAPSDAIQGKVIADVLLGNSSFDAGLGTAQRVGILYENGTYGQGLSQTIFNAISQQKTAQTFPYSRNGDVTGAVGQLNGFDPDVTVLIAFPEDAPRVVTAGATTTNLGRANHRWFFTDSAKDPTLYNNSSPAGEVEGDFGTAAAQGAGANYTFFSNTFRSRFGANPDSFSFTAHSYDAMYVLAYGMAYALGTNGAGAVSGERVAQGLTHLSSGSAINVGTADFIQASGQLAAGNSVNIVGTSGDLDFSPDTGEAPSKMEIWQVQGNSFVTAAKVAPAP